MQLYFSVSCNNPKRQLKLFFVLLLVFALVMLKEKKMVERMQTKLISHAAVEEKDRRTQWQRLGIKRKKGDVMKTR